MARMNAMTTQSRISAAAGFLNITEEELTKKLEVMGLSDADLIDDYVFRFGDFRDSLADKPIALVRKAYRALRGSKSESEQDARAVELKQKFGLKPTLETASLEQLLALYDMNKPQDPVTIALLKRFDNKAVLVFKSATGELDVSATVAYVNDLEQKLTEERDLVPDSGGTLVEPQMVGALVNVVLDEDPLFPGKPLRQHRSVVNHRNWERVNLINRQLCRIILERGEIDTENRDAVLRLIERAEKELLPEAFPEAFVEYGKRVITDDLPKLKMRPGDKPHTANNPFGIKSSSNRKY
jgi:hypothetical protein